LDSSEELIDAAAKDPKPEYISVIRERFAEYSPQAKQAALYLLSLLPEREAASAYMDLLDEYARSGRILRLPLMQIQNNPRHADIFFPRILDYANIKEFVRDIRLLLLSYLEAGLVNTDSISDCAKAVENDYAILAENLMGCRSQKVWIGYGRVNIKNYDETLRSVLICSGGSRTSV
jgi:hypothetical protein